MTVTFTDDISSVRAVERIGFLLCLYERSSTYCTFLASHAFPFSAARSGKPSEPSQRGGSLFYMRNMVGLTRCRKGSADVDVFDKVIRYISNIMAPQNCNGGLMFYACHDDTISSH